MTPVPASGSGSGAGGSGQPAQQGSKARRRKKAAAGRSQAPAAEQQQQPAAPVAAMAAACSEAAAELSTGPEQRQLLLQAAAKQLSWMHCCSSWVCVTWPQSWAACQPPAPALRDLHLPWPKVLSQCLPRLWRKAQPARVPQPAAARSQPAHPQ